MSEAPKLNLNEASAEELGRLPHIDYGCAQRIIDLRRRKGRIESIDQLAFIGGFGQEAIETLRAHTYV